MNSKFITILLLISAFIVFFFIFNYKNSENPQKILKIGDVLLNVDVASTDPERIEGLSGRWGLEENQGMLFIFEREGYYGFWMKDMNFPIDIAWLDINKKITHIEKNVSPETYPNTFYAVQNGLPVLNLYVLETNAGFFDKSKIKIGDTAEF